MKILSVGTESRTQSPTQQTAHTDACKTYRTAHTAVSLRMSPRGSKHVAKKQKLSINLENSSFFLFTLYIYITMHGAKKKIKEKYHELWYIQFLE